MTQGMSCATSGVRCEDVRAELRGFLWTNLGHGMEELSRHVQKDIQDEAKKFIGKFEAFMDELVLNTDKGKDILRDAAAIDATVEPASAPQGPSLRLQSFNVEQFVSDPESPKQVRFVPFGGIVDSPLNAGDAASAGHARKAEHMSPATSETPNSLLPKISEDVWADAEPLPGKTPEQNNGDDAVKAPSKNFAWPQSKAQTQTLSIPGSIPAPKVNFVDEVSGTDCLEICKTISLPRVRQSAMSACDREPALRHGASGSRRSLVLESGRLTEHLPPQWAPSWKRSSDSKSSIPGLTHFDLIVLVKSEYFDYIMGIFLMLNAVSIGVQVNYMASYNEKAPPLGFRIIDWLFVVVFGGELSLRLFAYGRSLYSIKGWKWNVFDTIVVFFQVIDELTMLFLAGTDVGEMITNVGILRMLRLGRIFRLIRMVRLIQELKSMVYLIAASMWSFFWTLVLLLLMMFCVAVYFTDSAGDLAKDWERSGDSEQLLQAVEIRKFWGSMSRSMLSLFQAITGGDDWRNFVEVFGIRSGGTYVLNTLVFAVYIAFATLVMLNLVTGVFVEGAQRIIKEDKDNELVRAVCKLFVMADENASQDITWEEFEQHINDPAMDVYFKAVDLNKEQGKSLFQLLDTDQSGTLTVEEFVRGCMRLKGPARSVDLSHLVQIFEDYAENAQQDAQLIERKLSNSHRILATCLTNLGMKVEHMRLGHPLQKSGWVEPQMELDESELA